MTWRKPWKSSVGPTEGLEVADVRLRTASLEEAGCLALLQVETRRSSGMPPSVHDLAALTTRLRARMAEDETWVAETDGVVVGYVRFTDQWLDDLYVDPARGRAGIGTLLVDLVKSRIPGGFGLWVFVENEGARAFYVRHGLIELEATDGSANDEQCPDVRMVWPGRHPRAYLSTLLHDVDSQLEELSMRRRALAAALADVDTRA